MNTELQQALTRLISRKFIIVMAMVISAHWLMNYQHISGNVYMYVILGTVAAYITGNVTQNIKLAAIPSETTTVGDVSFTNTVPPSSVLDKSISALSNTIKSTIAQSKLL